MGTHPLQVVVMAAGKGTRMRSAIPKALQCIGGKPLLGHVLQTAHALKAVNVVVVTGHQAPLVNAFVAQTAPSCKTALQEPQLGTGHCLMQAAPLLHDEGVTLVLSADVPLVGEDTLAGLVDTCAGERLALLTIGFADPHGYGRIVRSADGQTVQRIVEQKDADAREQKITECYGGIMAAPTRALKGWLRRLEANNAAGEYYLTDVVKLAVQEGMAVRSCPTADATQVQGVNTPAQLAELERLYQMRQARSLMDAGVRLMDPARLDVRGTLECGQDVQIDVNCVFEGEVHLGGGVRIGANCFIKDATIAAETVVRPFTCVEGEPHQRVQIGAGASVGPYARLRPGTRLAEEVHIGNFVEIKNSTLARGAKANHLAYLGDSVVGERVNYGAGSITANYDGANKHQTVIEDDVHIGSNCVLVAPLTIGAGGTVGAGSTLSRSTPAHALTVARARPVSRPGWQRPQKKKPQ